MRATVRLAILLAATTLAATALADTDAAESLSVQLEVNLACPFRASIKPIDAATARTMMNVSWHPGCPVPIEDLRAIDMTYWGFDDRPHGGRLIVHHDVSEGVVRAFKKMYDARFPIRRMEPVDRYGGSDDESMLADNTSSFNCRAKTGGTSWSVHSYGRAIDINTVENPYVKGTVVLPETGKPYVNRTNVRPGMILEGDVVTDAFDLEGFDWGGRWTTRKDYQHFEIVP